MGYLGGHSSLESLISPALVQTQFDLFLLQFPFIDPFKTHSLQTIDDYLRLVTVVPSDNFPDPYLVLLVGARDDVEDLDLI